jgi:hypothetical protein
VLLWSAMNNEIRWFLLGSHEGLQGQGKKTIGRVYNLSGGRDRTTEFSLRDESSPNI